MELTIGQALQQGVAFHNEGKFGEAERLYRAILQSQPLHPDANHNLGLLLASVNKTDLALPLFKTALTANSEIEQFWYSYIGALIKDNQFKDAKRFIKRAKKHGLDSERLESLWLQSRVPTQGQEPTHEQRTNLLEYYQTGNFDDAEKLAVSITHEFPRYQLAWKVLGALLGQTGRTSEAVKASQKAVVLVPHDADAHNNLANALKASGRLEEAEASYIQALTLKPDHAESHSNLGATLNEQGRLNEAERSYRQALAIKPDYAEAHNNLGLILQDLGRFEEAKKSYTQAIALRPDYPSGLSTLLFLYGAFNYETSIYLKEAQDYGRKISKSVVSRFSSWSCEAAPKRLRIGFVSGDLSNHPVGYFLEALLNKLNRSTLELFAYPTKSSEDELTLRIKPQFKAWRPLVGFSNKAAANLIHNDGIHILIDLSGHTANNGLPVFAWKPAPVQITWLGYFASTGVAEIDYILGDPYVTPVGEADNYTEKIWRLPESYLCFTEPTINVDVAPLHALGDGIITFGCFNKIERMTDHVIAVWARILKAIPDSRLFLKDKTLSDSHVRRSVCGRFQLVGIEKNQLILEGRSPRSEYLAAYNRVDIALSPFPYGGGTTSVEGLWMGVPVIVKRGTYFLSHLGESIAHNAGLSNWIASDDDEYVAKALEFTDNLGDLAALRSRLRAQVLSSPLFDAERFSCHFENSLRDMWERRKEEKLPEQNNI